MVFTSKMFQKHEWKSGILSRDAGPFCWERGGQLSLPNFENGVSEKSECLEGLNEFLLRIFAMGVYVSCQKKYLKMKCGSEGSI